MPGFDITTVNRHVTWLLAGLLLYLPASVSASTQLKNADGSRLELDRPAVSHGLVFWFETELYQQIGFSTNPWLPAEERGSTYGNSFLPWSQPVALRPGQRLECVNSPLRQGPGQAVAHSGLIQAPPISPFFSIAWRQPTLAP